MQKEVAKIHYLYHSAFAVKTDAHFLIFDYYNDKPAFGKSGIDAGVITSEELADLNTVVFVSHSHGDHFNPVIFEWQKNNADIRYVLSSDVPKTGKKIYSMNPREVLDLGDLKVETFGSTDQGVSFLVTVDKLSIFHAGDLNWWHWKDESTESEVEQSEKDFLKEVEAIILKSIDIAFFPVDPRLGSGYYLGGERFAELVKPSMLVPMHFGEKYEAAAEFALKTQSSKLTVPMILRRGQTFIFNKQK